jgi:hypothetical protein
LPWRLSPVLGDTNAGDGDYAAGIAAASRPDAHLDRRYLVDDVSAMRRQAWLLLPEEGLIGSKSTIPFFGIHKDN